MEQQHDVQITIGGKGNGCPKCPRLPSHASEGEHRIESDSVTSTEVNRRLHGLRIPYADAIEPQMPAIFINSSHDNPHQQRDPERVSTSVLSLPTFERGTNSGIPFDTCSLSTVGGGSERKHRRVRRRTTTVVTTTTITKILLPSPSHLALLDKGIACGTKVDINGITPQDALLPFGHGPHSDTSLSSHGLVVESDERSAMTLS
ncbi:hypothetical protein ERJ75_001228300 [Trypanosoma vivax]|nr:hypothetical protein ERJ75_001228300 [Trypanosoma vivax]